MEIECERCLKSTDLCICSLVQPLATRTQVLILQHPQEPNEDLGSARLAHLALANSNLKIGLSWPNLKKALGKEVQASQWAVLYLGSGIKGADGSDLQKAGKSEDPAAKAAARSEVKAKAERSAAARPIPVLAGAAPASSAGTASPAAISPPKAQPASLLQFVTSKGAPVPRPNGIEGIVILDGTWSQAKALWWRNAWLLKLKRAVLIPQRRSLYKNLRKEPRRECLSTIESIAETLIALGEPPEVAQTLEGHFKALLDKHRARSKSKKPEQKPAE